MILDDGPSGRGDARARLAVALERPFDAGEAAAYDVEQARVAWERQYLTETAGQSGAENDAAKDAVFGQSTYGSVG